MAVNFVLIIIAWEYMVVYPRYRRMALGAFIRAAHDSYATHGWLALAGRHYEPHLHAAGIFFLKK